MRSMRVVVNDNMGRTSVSRRADMLPMTIGKVTTFSRWRWMYDRVGCKVAVCVTCYAKVKRMQNPTQRKPRVGFRVHHVLLADQV